MKTIALLLAAVTASAYADVDHRTPMDPRFEHHHRYRGDNDWVNLASPTSTKWGTEYIIVGADQGWFRTIRIEAVAGRVLVKRITVTSGRFVKTYPVNAWIDGRHPVVYVDFGRPWLIDQLAITTARRPAGSYIVQGSSGPTPPRPRLVSER